MVSNTVMIVSLVIGLVLALYISSKFGINAGVLGFVVAWIVGGWMGNLPATTLISYWPNNVMLIVISTALFFGVARENGTLTLFAEKIMYATRKISWFPPIAIYLCAWIIGASGGGGIAAETSMSAIGFSIAGQTGMNPMLVLLACFLGGMGGGGMFWSAEGANRIAYYSQVGVSDDVVSKTVIYYSLYTIIIYTLIFLVGYVLFKGWKNKLSSFEMKKPAPFNAEQKKTLGLTLTCLVLIIGASIWKSFWPSDLSKYLANNLSVQLLLVAGFVVACFMKIAEPKKIMKRVPWDMILNIGGMSVMIKVLINCGLTEMIENFFATASIPNILVPVMFFLMAGVITLFSNFTVIYPLLMPLVPVVSAATGINSVTIFTGMALGSGLPGCSPYSTGGACCLSGCADEEERTKLVPKLFLMSLTMIVIAALILMTPLVRIFPEVL